MLIKWLYLAGIRGKTGAGIADPHTDIYRRRKLFCSLTLVGLAQKCALGPHAMCSAVARNFPLFAKQLASRDHVAKRRGQLMEAQIRKEWRGKARGRGPLGDESVP